MEPQTFYLWRDALDPNYFTIGVKITMHPSGNVRYAGWGQVYIDGINEMFGADVYTMARESKQGVPFAVTFQRVT